MDEHAWLKKGAELLTDIKEWRRVHPKATFVEIEDEVHRRMMQLEAQVLQDAAQASASREWGQMKEASAPLCPSGPIQRRPLQTVLLQPLSPTSVPKAIQLAPLLPLASSPTQSSGETKPETASEAQSGPFFHPTQPRRLPVWNSLSAIGRRSTPSVLLGSLSPTCVPPAGKWAKIFFLSCPATV